MDSHASFRRRDVSSQVDRDEKPVTHVRESRKTTSASLLEQEEMGGSSATVEDSATDYDLIESSTVRSLLKRKYQPKGSISRSVQKSNDAKSGGSSREDHDSDWVNVSSVTDGKTGTEAGRKVAFKTVESQHRGLNGNAGANVSFSRIITSGKRHEKKSKSKVRKSAEVAGTNNDSDMADDEAEK